MAADAEHLPQELLSEGEQLAVHAILGLQPPPGAALLERVQAIARRKLVLGLRWIDLDLPPSRFESKAYVRR